MKWIIHSYGFASTTQTVSTEMCPIIEAYATMLQKYAH
jgi:hypothetical protein